MAANTFSLQFNGSTQYGRKLSPTGLYGKSQYTIETWVRISTISSGSVLSLVILGTVAGNSEVVAQLYRESGNKFQLFLGHGGNATSITGGTTPAQDTWYHVVGTYDGADLRLYVGTNVGDDASDATAVSATGTMNTPGASHDLISFAVRGLTSETDLQNYLPGYLDEVRIWDTALSLAQINSNKYKKLDGTEPNLIGLWNNNDGSGATSTDETGTNDIALTGTPTWSPTVPFPTYAGEDDGNMFLVM